MIDVIAMAELAQTSLPGPDAIWNWLTIGGPLAGVMGYGLWYVNGERVRLQEENRALRTQYELELKQVNERLFNGLTQSTLAISNGAQSAEAIKNSLGVIIDHIIRRREQGDS